jgi:hypothetical protein
LKVLEKGDTYFVALVTGEVYQGIYRGFHSVTQSHWFEPSPFASAYCGKPWVHDSQIAAAISLGQPQRNGEFVAALTRILE